MDYVDAPPKRKGSFAPQSFSSSKDKGKGGSSCHQCKSRRNIDALTYCTNSLDSSKKKRCRKKFCGHCLKKFYKENAAAADKKTWKCPSCRKTCCCAACRRRKQKDQGLPIEKPTTRADGILASMSASQSTAQSTPAPVAQSTPAPPRETPRGSLSTPFDSDISIPPVPVITLPREGLSSPIPSSIPSPPGFDDELSLLSSGEQESTPFDPRMRVSSAQVGDLLEQHIKEEAQLVEKSEKNPHFSRLYNLALTPVMKRKIEMILFKKDIPKSQKVDCIASLLRKHQEKE